MYFIYSLLLGLGFLILLPRFLLDALRHGKYVIGFRERWGSVAPQPQNGRPVIWIHCVSVGETQAALPLVQAIRARFPQSQIAISTITLTGQNLAREIFTQDAARIFYFPFDWRWVVRRTLKVIRPDAVLVMETELWPGFLRECEQRRIPVALVNGRLSEQSFRRYRVIKGFIARVLGSLHLAIMQTEADADRLRALGMPRSKILISGSLKFDGGTIPSTDMLTTEFRQRFGLDDESLLIIAASTHDPEEEIVLKAFRQLAAKSAARARLLIAPRHPERFGEVAAQIAASGVSWTRRTNPAAATDEQVEIILLDSIGELRSLYSLGSIVFVGGSIARTGGHNVLEPAATGACVITGAHTFNFHSIVETFVEAGAMIQLPPVPASAASEELASAIAELISNPARRVTLGKRAREVVNENRGATERTLLALEAVLAAPNLLAEKRPL